MASAEGGILGDLVFSDSSQQPGRHLCPTASTIGGLGSSYGAFWTWDLEHRLRGLGSPYHNEKTASPFPTTSQETSPVQGSQPGQET